MNRLPDGMRAKLSKARRERGWSQAELGQRAGLPQAHISGIETGKVAPRYDTLLDLVRVLGLDVLLVPRELVPVIQALTRDYGKASETEDSQDDERPLYAGEAYEDDES